MKCLTYLGNKRKLLKEIHDQIKTITPSGVVLDLFSGSGVVSWYLREQGYSVLANDIAPYSYHLNVANLEYTPDTLQSAHPDLDKLIARINALTEPLPGAEYFSNYYSENPATKYQRLYYTRRNGLFLDAALHEIHNLRDKDKKSLLLSDLLYKMSKHVNTNGHFKTFHKEFGGLTNKHDVERITAPIVIERPEPSNGPVGKAYCLDAGKMLEGDLRYDVAYLDPPYNQHQYSGNYHLLEAACLPKKDRYIPKDSQISGIDPKLYKSPFCLKQKCLEAFTGIMNRLVGRSKGAVISYNAKGFIDLATMETTLSKYGQVHVEPIDNCYRIGTRKTGTAKKPDRDVREYLFRVIW